MATTIQVTSFEDGRGTTGTSNQALEDEHSYGSSADSDGKDGVKITTEEGPTEYPAESSRSILGSQTTSPDARPMSDDITFPNLIDASTSLTTLPRADADSSEELRHGFASSANGLSEGKTHDISSTETSEVLLSADSSGQATWTSTVTINADGTTGSATKSTRQDGRNDQTDPTVRESDPSESQNSAMRSMQSSSTNASSEQEESSPMSIADVRNLVEITDAPVALINPDGVNPTDSKPLVTNSGDFEHPREGLDDGTQSTKAESGGPQLPVSSSDAVSTPTSTPGATTPFDYHMDQTTSGISGQSLTNPIESLSSENFLVTPSTSSTPLNGSLGAEVESPPNPSDDGLSASSTSSPSTNFQSEGAPLPTDTQHPGWPSTPIVSSSGLSDSENRSSAPDPSINASPNSLSSNPSGPNTDQPRSYPNDKSTSSDPKGNTPPFSTEYPIEGSQSSASANPSQSDRPMADSTPYGIPSMDLFPSNSATRNSPSPELLFPTDPSSSVMNPDPSEMQSPVDATQAIANSKPENALIGEPQNDTIDPSLFALLNKINFLEQSTDIVARTTNLKAALPFLTSQLSPEIQKQIGIQWSMTFVKCYYSRSDCLVETDFRWDLTALFGSCFTFNFNDTSVRTFAHAGPQYGLSLTLYTYQEDFICTTDSTGFKISLQLPTEAPFPETSGIYAMPGVVTSTIISRVTNLKRDDCIQNGDLNNNYYYDGTYTVEGCMRSCHQKYAMQQCGCADPRYPKPEEERFCDLDDMMCLENFLACSQDLLTTDQCSCKQVCRETQYHSIVTTSAINFDTAAWIPICDKYIGSAWNGTCLEYLQKSIAVVNIYYDRLSEVVNTEEDAYPNLDYLSDLFAWMGLSFGICFGTVVEIGFIMVDVIAEILAKIFKRKLVNLLDEVEPRDGSAFD